jgi:hypothetical protein
MSDREPGTGMDPCAQYLLALRDELAGRGTRCELDGRGIWPRLRIYCPSETAAAQFDNNVVAALVRGRWCYCWPWAELIGPVTRPSQAAETILSDLGIADSETAGPGGGEGAALSDWTGRARGAR